MMMAWRWVSRADVVDLHAESIARFGGLPGIKDEGLLRSGLEAPINLYVYEDPTVFELAARYARLAKNHAFHDGNKRVGYFTAKLFLALNDVSLRPPAEGMTELMIAYAAGTASEKDLVLYFERWSRVI